MVSSASPASPPSGEFVAEGGPDRPIGVGDLGGDGHPLAALERRLGLGDDVLVEPPGQHVGLGANPPARLPRPRLRRPRQPFESELACLRCIHDLEQVRTTDDLVQRPGAELGQPRAHLVGEEPEELLDELRPTAVALAKDRILRGDPDRAGVLVAHPHHDAPRHHERGGRKTELLGTEERGDDHVACGLELAVHLEGHPIAQPVGEQSLVRLGEAELPGTPCVGERREWSRSRPAVATGDQDHIGVRLGDPSGHRADAGLGDQLDVHPCPRIGRLEVVDQLGEVFDGVDVMVGAGR